MSLHRVAGRLLLQSQRRRARASDRRDRRWRMWQTATAKLLLLRYRALQGQRPRRTYLRVLHRTPSARPQQWRASQMGRFGWPWRWIWDRHYLDICHCQTGKKRIKARRKSLKKIGKLFSHVNMKVNDDDWGFREPQLQWLFGAQI